MRRSAYDVTKYLNMRRLGCPDGNVPVLRSWGAHLTRLSVSVLSDGVRRGRRKLLLSFVSLGFSRPVCERGGR